MYPALTPLAVDPGHPFPNVRNKTLNLAILLQRGSSVNRGQEASFAVMQVPSVFSRLVEIPTPGPRRVFVCLEDVISLHAVSYTHLDVYKRQEESRSEEGCSEEGRSEEGCSEEGRS